jgi:hypothetical protein
VTIEGAGRIDLLLQIVQESRRAEGWAEGWIEVKIDSPESGDQLAHYAGRISAFPADRRPFLATLSKDPLTTGVTPLTWQALWDESRDNPSPYWADLRSFLEELEMADAFNCPIKQHEIAALSDSHSLLRKAVHILLPVAERVNAMWPPAALPTKHQEVLEMAARQFAYNRFTIYTSAHRVFLVLGIRADTSNAELAIWLELDKPHAYTRKTSLIQQADTAGLSDLWQRIGDLDVVETLLATRPLEQTRPLVEHSEWLNARVEEIARAGLFALIPSL